MSQAAVEAFVKRTEEDEAFRNELLEANSQEARIQLVRDAGYDVTADDLAELRRQVAEELSEEDLEKIAGGAAGQTTWALSVGGGGISLSAAMIAAAYV